MIGHALIAHRGRDDDQVAETQFLIQDNGIGFDMAYCEKIFEAFERLNRAEDYKGTGIGLTTVKRIIDRHGGKVWAESDGIGTGARFYFTIG